MSRDLERDLLARLSDELPRRDFLKLGATTAGALALAACGGSTPAPASGPTGPDFKIGAILPSSGTYAELGDSIRKGMQLYFDKVGNKAGNRRLVVLDEDEAAGDTSIPLNKARKLVEQDTVDMLTGLVASPNAVPTLISNAGANALSRALKSAWVYRTSFSNWQPSQPMGKYLTDNGIRRLTLVYSNYESCAPSSRPWSNLLERRIAQVRFFRADAVSEVSEPVAERQRPGEALRSPADRWGPRSRASSLRTGPGSSTARGLERLALAPPVGVKGKGSRRNREAA